MYFKSLDVAGFKSFADRLEIKFDSGVTAIVGPNGCGKSNVADAIRWVLGEQSSKLLRGSSMQDVIFNGTEKRKSLSYAEVTLSFNNQDRFFNYDYDELAITRKLYRSGESEYLINRVPCRLRDIVDLLHDSGIGRDGYSIIGQGKVEEIISSKPENRRGIFEEAAGIAKFKSKKVESERKLERVRDNLTRIKDILSEIERHLEPLKKQSETAKKYLELRDQLKDLETNIYVYQYDNASDQKAKIMQKLSGISEQLALRQDELNKATEGYNASMAEVSNIDKLMDELHEQILHLSVNIEKQASEIKIVKERINLLSEHNDKINLDITNCNNNILKLTAERENKLERVKVKQKNLIYKNSEQKKIYDRYLTIVDELTLYEDEAESSQKEMIDALDKLTDIKSKSSRLEAERKASEENIAAIRSRISAINEKIKSNEELASSSREEVEAMRAQKESSEKDCADVELQMNILNSNIKDVENKKNSNFAKIQVYENRRKLLLEMQAEYEGYAGSVKKLLKESERNIGIKNKMVGVLASLIKVPANFETAIEMALGNAVQNIVTFDENGAKDLIRFLKENQFGRATFMPITSMKPRNISQEDRKYLAIDGCFGVASELISFDKKIAPVISNLLGATVVVEDLDIAVKLAQNTRFAFKIVTLDGDIVNPQGSLTGGSKRSEAVNLISREREINTLAEQIEKLKSDIDKKQKYIGSSTLEVSALQGKLVAATRLRNEAEINFAKVSEKLDNIEFQLYSLKEELAQEENLKTLTENKIKFIDDELNSVAGLENVEATNRKKATESTNLRQEKFASLRSERDDLIQKITESKVKIAELETTISSLSTDCERLAFEVEDENTNLENLKRELIRNQQTIDGANSIIQAQIEAQTSQEDKEKLQYVRSQLAGLDDKKMALQNSIKELDEAKTNLMSQISVLTEKKHNEEMQLAKVDTDIEAMQERIYEEYGLTYQTCQEFKRPDFDINQGMIECNKCKKDISRLGYVNVNAIEEYKETSVRYEDMKTQCDDLEKSEEDLVKIIKELSNEMITRFETQFNQINANFKQTFKELFGGGNARLELTGSDNLLEAGIEIVAEPPGKKLQSITLLSGGEKALTAIAILFAILKLRPMPFCLLDEIEAALDDANVDRFAQYLRRFSKETQFIVITHRKPTMELADSLYGVTMEEKGVSKIVSVKLSEAVKQVEEAS